MGIKTLTNGKSRQRSSTGGGDIEIPIGQIAATTVGSRTCDLEKLRNLWYRVTKYLQFNIDGLNSPCILAELITKHTLRREPLESHVSNGRGRYDRYDDIVNAEVEDGREKCDLESDCKSWVIGDDEVFFLDE